MRKTAAAITIVLLLLAALFLAGNAKAERKTITVPDDYSTIASAIENAADGDTIFIKNGTYAGPANKTLIISKTLFLIGESTEETRIILHPPLVPMQLFTYQYMGYSDAIKIEANSVKLANLTVTSDGGGISIFGNATEIAGNLIGMSITATGERTRILENRIAKVTVGGLLESKTASVIMSGTNQTVARNTIEGTVASAGLYNCIISNHINGSSTEGVVELKGSINVVYGNTIDGNDWYGITVKSNSSIVARNNITHSVGIYMRWASNNIVCANRMSNFAGIDLVRGNDNVFYANHLENNTIGISVGFDQSDIARSSGPSTVNNTVYHNNFVGNGRQAVDWNWLSTNYWDNGREGNYWSDYSGSDWNFDGIGDTPYQLSEAVSHYAPSTKGEDRYPLMSPFDIDSTTVILPEWASPSISPSPMDTPSNTKVEPFPVVLVAASVAVVAVVTVVALLLLYRKKHKGNSNS